MSSAEGGAQGTQAIARALDLLELVEAAESPLSASELARSATLPYPTTHRLLQVLAGRGYLFHDPVTRRYSLGSRFLVAGARVESLFAQWSKPLLQDLVDISGETANLAILDGRHVTYVAQVQSERQQLRMFTHVGNRVMPHATAVGKVLLAGLPEVAVRQQMERFGMPARTPNTITDVDLFLAELALVRRQGFASDDEEGEVGVRCIAVPVARLGSVDVALSVSGPSARIDVKQQELLIPRMRETAKSLSEVMVSGSSHKTLQDGARSR